MSKKKDIQTFGQHAILFDRYAGRIEKLPVLGVDKELIQYSAFVAQQLRNGSQIVRMKGIRTGVQQSTAVVSGSGDVYTYGYVNGCMATTATRLTTPARTSVRIWRSGGTSKRRRKARSRAGAADQEPDHCGHKRHPLEDDGEVQGRVCALKTAVIPGRRRR